MSEGYRQERCGRLHPVPLRGKSVPSSGKLRTIKGRAIVSLNDHPDIRRVFDGFHIEAVPIQYTLGGGGRAAKRSELNIFSRDDAAQPAGLF